VKTLLFAQVDLEGNVKKIPVSSAEPDMVVVGASTRGKLPASRIVSKRPAREGEALGVLDGDYLVVFE